MKDDTKRGIANVCAIVVVICAAIGICYTLPGRQKEVDPEETVVEKPKSNVNVCGHIIGEEFVPRPEYKYTLKGDAYTYLYDNVTLITFCPVGGKLKYASITKIFAEWMACGAEQFEMEAYYTQKYHAKPQQPGSLLTEDGVRIDINSKRVDGRWILSIAFVKLDK